MVKPFNQLYITNKTERFSFKSEHFVRVAKLIKQDWPIVLQQEFRLKTLLLKHFITKVLEYKAEEFNCYVFLSDESLFT